MAARCTYLLPGCRLTSHAFHRRGAWQGAGMQAGQEPLLLCLSPFRLLSEKCRRLGLKQQTFISPTSGGWGPRSRQPQILSLVRASSLVPRCLRLCPHLVGAARELPGVPLMMTLISFVRAPPSWPNHVPKAPPPNIIALGLDFKIGIWGGKLSIPAWKVLFLEAAQGE